MEWIKRFFSTDTSDLQKHNRQLQKLLADALKDSQAQSAKLIECLDRVIVSRFDPPMKAQPQEQINNGYNLTPEHLSDVLSVEDDTEFLERVNA